jgi:hypothetical protein
MKISRRKIIAIAGAGAIASVTGLFVSWKTARETDIVVAILRRRLRPLKADRAIFEEFSRDYILTRLDYAKQMRLLGAVSGLLSIVTPYQLLPLGHPWRRLENNIVSMFLLSTDFFQNGADPQKKIQYLGLYDPYRRPCVQFFTTKENS